MIAEFIPRCELVICDQWSKEQMGNILNSFTGPLHRAQTALGSVDIRSLARPLWMHMGPSLDYILQYDVMKYYSNSFLNNKKYLLNELQPHAFSKIRSLVFVFLYVF